MHEDEVIDYDPYDPKSVYLKENPRRAPRPMLNAPLFIGRVMLASLLLYGLVLAKVAVGQNLKIVIALIGGPALGYLLVTLGVKLVGRPKI